MTVKRDYPIEKFLGGLVSRLMRTYQINESERDDMLQSGWVKILQVQQDHPRKAKNRKYLERAVVNCLIQIEQRDRPRRTKTESLEDKYTQPGDTKTRLLVDDLLDKANLTPAEQIIVQMTYGLDNWTAPLPVRTIARKMGKEERWVEQRLTAARLKLGITGSAASSSFMQ